MVVIILDRLSVILISRMIFNLREAGTGLNGDTWTNYSLDMRDISFLTASRNGDVNSLETASESGEADCSFL